jgi:hypothetical protein
LLGGCGAGLASFHNLLERFLAVRVDLFPVRVDLFSKVHPKKIQCFLRQSGLGVLGGLTFQERLEEKTSVEQI